MFSGSTCADPPNPITALTPKPQPYPSNLPLNPTPTKWDDNPSRPSYSMSFVGVVLIFIYLFLDLVIQYLSLELYCSLNVLGIQPYLKKRGVIR